MQLEIGKRDIKDIQISTQLQLGLQTFKMGTLTFKNRDPMLLKQTGWVPPGTFDFLGPYFQRLGYHPNLKFTQRMSIQSAYIQQWEKCLLTSSVLHLSNLNFYSCSCVKFHWIWVPILCTRGPYFIKMWVLLVFLLHSSHNANWKGDHIFKQARKLQDAQAVKLTSLKLTSLKVDELTNCQVSSLQW